MLLNGLNLWITPSYAKAKEDSIFSVNHEDTNCSSAIKNSIKSLEEINDLKRLIGYVESSVNDIKMTVNNFDRKIDEIKYSNQDKKK